MTSSDHNQTPPFLDDDDDDIDEDTEEEEDDDDEEEEEELEPGNNNNNIIIEDDDDLTAAAADSSLNSDPTTTSVVVTIAVPPPPIVHDTLVPDESTPKRPRIVDDEPPIRDAAPVSSHQPASTGDDQARKLFQRLWTDEDEIGLLQGFLDYSTQRGTSHNNPHDTALFYDQIKSKLQLDFNKNQLVEKLRRLKKKYRNVLARISSGKEVSFKSPHDQATFEIACKIWGTTTAHTHTSVSKDHHQNYQQLLQRRIDVDDDMPPNFNHAGTNLNLNFASNFNSSGGYNTSHHSSDRLVADERRLHHKSAKKRSREKAEDARVLMDQMGAVPASSSHAQIPTWPPGMGLSTPAMAEEKAKNKMSPLFWDMFERSGGGGRGFVDGIVSPVPLSFVSPPVNMFGIDVVDEKWRRQQILELEVYSKRLELVQEQIKLTLEQLRQ